MTLVYTLAGYKLSEHRLNIKILALYYKGTKKKIETKSFFYILFSELAMNIYFDPSKM